MSMSNLFQEGKIGTMVLKNRVVFPAMGTKMPDEQGYVTDRLIEYHVARVKGGCGLNVVEVAAVHPTSKWPHVLGLNDDKYLPGLTKLATAIRDAGGKSCIQVWHAGKVAMSTEDGSPTLSASPEDDNPYLAVKPKEISKEEIKNIIKAYGEACLRAKKAGFDSIQIHAGHGYLIPSFISRRTNKRQDEYGGSFENRIRFALEVIDEIRNQVGPDYPILLRTSVEHLENGMTVEDIIDFAKEAEKHGVDAFDISAGTAPETVFLEVPPVDVPIGFNVDSARRVKEAVNVPVITAGRINDPFIAEEIIKNGQADFVDIGRGQLADPEFCNKAERGDVEQIVKCIGCNQGCFDKYVQPGEFISCMRNPACGHEAEYLLEPAPEKKKILVIGGGPAGLESAITLKRRGHEVILCEKENHLGGQFYIAGVAPRKSEMTKAAIQMGEIARQEGVEIRLETAVDYPLIEEIQPDEIIVATGAVPFIPNIPGVDLAHVVNSHDVLKDKVSVGKNVVIIGGGLIGMEVAELLSEQGKIVTVVEMQAEVAKDIGMLRKVFTMKHAYEKGIKLLVNSKCLEIKEDTVLIEQGEEQLEVTNIDTVILAVGSKAYHPLEGYLEKSKIPFHVIGDAHQPRKALEAIWEGNKIGRAI